MKGRRRTATTELSVPELLIGRDPMADLSLESASRVSRRHAVVKPYGDAHTLADLGSSNGTTVNGIPISDPVLLTPGDTIELAEEVTFVYELGEAPDGGGLRMLLAAGLVALAAGGAALWWFSRDGDPQLPEEALEFAQKGLDAQRAGDAISARRHLDRATTLLFESGQLEDVPRRDMEQVAFARLGGALGYEGDLKEIYWTAVEDAKPKRQSELKQATGCALDRVGPADLPACLAERIQFVMVELHQDPTAVPERFHDLVGQRLRIENQFLRNSLERGKPLMPTLRRELEAHHMPPLLHYLALIESGYKSTAVSPAKAAGLWQFMPATAKQYGLEVSKSNDERLDNAKATRAAAQYLRNLTMEFGGESLLLVLAGYNRGENGVRRALKKLENPFKDRDYWRLVEMELIPEETAKYVPRFIAAAVAGEGGLPDVSTLKAAGY